MLVALDKDSFSKMKTQDIYKENINIKANEGENSLHNSLRNIDYPSYDLIDCNRHLDRSKKYPLITLCSSISHGFITLFISEEKLYLCTQKKLFEGEFNNRILSMQKRVGLNYLLYY
jgi:hypothetical protein